MIFFVGMGVMFGIINLSRCLCRLARAMSPFPFSIISAFGYLHSGAMFILVSLVIGFYAGTGWSAYPPLAGIKYNPGWVSIIGYGVCRFQGRGRLLSGINFLVTILKMRCPGMTLMKMPIFVWATLVTMILVVFAFPS